jgi:hypothetical protein
MSGLGLEVPNLELGDGQLSINSSCTNRSSENICSSSGGTHEEGRFSTNTSITIR